MGSRPIVAFIVVVMLALRLRSALSDVHSPHFSVPKEVQKASHVHSPHFSVPKEVQKASHGGEAEPESEAGKGKTDGFVVLDDHLDDPATSRVEEWHTMQKQNGGNHSGHVGLRYHVATFDFAYVATPFIVSLWVIFASVSKIVFHLGNRLSACFPESCLLIVIGIVLGLILFSAGLKGYQLDTTTFFLILMPPIILDAGYFLPTRPFFDNIGTILLFAVFGTLLNTLWIGSSVWMLGATGMFELGVPLTLLHALVFAALLAAVDPVAVLAVFEELQVNDVLYIIVLGESMLNDGISVVLYRMFTGFSIIGPENILPVDALLGITSFFVIVFGSTFIGIVCGFLGSFLSRFTSHVRVIEPIIVFVIGYLSFLSAEMFHLSGMISCMFCGVTMKKYVEANISLKSHTTIKYFMKMMSSICESIIFMYLGISVVCDKHQWNSVFILMTLILCLLCRTLGVVLLTAIANRLRSVQLSYLDQFIMSYGGLRGAVAFALVVLLKDDFPNKQLFVTTTVVVIYFTNLVMGSTIKPLVRCLKVKKSDKHKPSMNEKITLRCVDHLMAGVEDITGQHGHHLVRERFLELNNKYLKPLLIRESNAQPRGWSILNVCQKLDEHDARELLKHSASFSSQPDFGFLASNSFARLFSSRMHVVEADWSDNCLSAQNHNQHHQWKQQQHQMGCNLSSLLGLPETGSMTCLDLQAQEVQDTRKMRDDSKIHHIVEDSMFKPRKVFNHHRHHPSAEAIKSTDRPHHHSAPVHLRHLLSHNLRHQGPSRPQEPDAFDVVNDIPSRLRHGNSALNAKSSKNVSFAEVADVDADDVMELDNNSLQAQEGDRDSSKSDDEGIMFTVSVSATPSEEDVDEAEEHQMAPVAAELSLPWKRNSGREPLSSVITHSYSDDRNPVRGEAPSWVDIPEFLAEAVDNASFDFPDDEEEPLRENLPPDGGASNTSKLSDTLVESVSSDSKQVAESDSGNFPFPWKTNYGFAPAGSDIEEALEREGIVDDMRGLEENEDDRLRDVGLPLPWRTNRSQTCAGKMNHRNQDLELGLGVAHTKRHLIKSNSVPTRDSQVVHDNNVCLEMEDDLPPLPWRNPTVDRAIPDQHAPRPPRIIEDESSNDKQDHCGLSLPWKNGDNDGFGSPCASFDHESYSVHPQLSCHSFRLSEAESRHSEPVHLHHVIEIVPRPSVDLEDLALPELDEMDSYERVSNWLNSTETPPWELDENVFNF